MNGANKETRSPANISLFVHMMRGDYDDILDWPFRGRISVSILDLHPGTAAAPATPTASTPARSASGKHSGGKQHQHQQSTTNDTVANGNDDTTSPSRRDISAVVDEIDPTLEAFQRPSASSSRNRRGFGYVEFASLDELLTPITAASTTAAAAAAGSASSVNSKYLMNDTMYIRAVVESLNR